MMKIPRDRLFVQVPYEDLVSKLWLITLFKINCEIYIKPKEVDSCLAPSLDRIKATLDKNKILKRFHAPIYDPYKEGFGIFREAYSKSSRFCKSFGIDTIIMHVEYESERYPSLEEWLKETIQIWDWIASQAEKDDILVLIENHNESQAEPIVRILNDVASRNLKACFDVGHFNAFGKIDLTSYLDDYPEGSIKEIHLSDNLRDADTHLTLGKGAIDFVKFFNALETRSIDAAYAIEASDLWGVIGGIGYLKRIGAL